MMRAHASGALHSASPSRVLAFDTHSALSSLEFWQRVHAISAAIAVRSEQRWALVCEDSAWFAAGLLAIANAGRVSVLPQAPQAGSITISGAHIDAVLTDQPRAFADFATLSMAAVPRINDATPCWPEDSALMESYTSGSSGTPKCVLKTFGQVRREVHTLEQEWGAQLGDALVLGTVPHHHLYGLLVRVFWPLLAGRPFLTSMCLQLAELRRWAAEQRCVIVSSPAFLSRLPDVSGLPPVTRVAAVFSSGAPLADDCAAHLQRDWGGAPIEIYGSTETGGIAWRTWSGAVERPFWRLLRGVQVDLREEPAGQRLWVKSGFTWQSDWMATGDLARLHADGRLVLLGRADDVVKFEDKRVSLHEMRTRLVTHAWVQDARLLLLEGRRRVIGAVVLLNAEGRRQLATSGKLAVNRGLRDWLRQTYEPVVMPRKWRFPESLPVNDMGKLEWTNLQGLFGKRA